MFCFVIETVYSLLFSFFDRWLYILIYYKYFFFLCFVHDIFSALFFFDYRTVAMISLSSFFSVWYGERGRWEGWASADTTGEKSRGFVSRQVEAVFDYKVPVSGSFFSLAFANATMPNFSGGSRDTSAEAPFTLRRVRVSEVK